MKTIFAVAREINNEIIFSCGNLADAQEMVLELAKEGAYENFIYCMHCGWGPKQTSEEFWEALEDDIKWAKEQHRSPIENPYWELVNVCADGFYILDTVLLD